MVSRRAARGRRAGGWGDAAAARGEKEPLFFLSVDLSDLLRFGTYTDAVILAQITHVPAFVWAGLWSAISVLVVVTAGKRALTLPP
jgi:hypothetical protein